MQNIEYHDTNRKPKIQSYKLGYVCKYIVIAICLTIIIIASHFFWGDPCSSAIRYTTVDNKKLTLNENTDFADSRLYDIYPFKKGVIQFPYNLSIIRDEVFSRNERLCSIEIPEGVKCIDWGAFNGCINLTSVTMYDGLKDIGQEAFIGCSSLESVTIPGSVEEIDCRAFSGCLNLKDLTISDGVIAIGNEAFSGCTSLTNIRIPESVTTLGNYVFDGCEKLCKFEGKYASNDGRCLIINNILTEFAPSDISQYTIPMDVTEIGDNVFSLCNDLTSVTISNNVTHIGNGAFSGCDNLKQFKGKFASEDGRCLINNNMLIAIAPAELIEFVIPNGITWIKADTFKWSRLQKISLPPSVTNIGERAFALCHSLKDITIPDGVTKINGGTFSCCWSLEEITLPEGITEIGNRAFGDCTSLTRVYCKATTPPKATYTEEGVFTYNNIILNKVTKYSRQFDGCNSSLKIYVPIGSVEAYKNAPGWEEYADQIIGYDFED